MGAARGGRHLWLVARWLAVGLWLALALPPRPALAEGPLAGRVVVIDPGHGGGDPGAMANGLEEKNITLPIGLDLGAALADQGARVIYTRDADVSVGTAADGHGGLSARTAVANTAHADIFISIHANAMRDPGYSGLQTFYGAAGGYVDGITRTPAVEDQSRLLARDVHAGTVRRTQETDRGVRSADFYVLGNTAMPAILVETGFLTNAAEARRLADPAFQQTVAAGIADGVAAFFAAVGATARQSTAADDGRFLADLTYPDGSAVPAGQTLLKTWRIANSGTTTWGAGYTLQLQPGGDLAAAERVPLPPLSPGASGSVSVSASAPADTGPHSATWRFVAADGRPFGSPLWLDVTVPAAPFARFWVETTQAATLWDDPDRHADALAALAQWTYLHVTGPAMAGRLPVTEPLSRRQGYVDATAVGPSGPPPAGYQASGGGDSPSAPPVADGTPAAPPNPASAAPSSPAAYVVQPGDTLSGIAARFQVGQAALARANDIPDPNLLVAGRTLRLPTAAAAFRPFWVENDVATPLWSGVDAAARRFGLLSQWTPMQVLAPADHGRYLVRVWTTGGLAYVDGAAVGPAGPPAGAG